MAAWRTKPQWRLTLAAVALAAMAASPFLVMADNVRIGIIGLDTSHAEEFTLRLNDPANPNHIPGARVVAAFPTSSPDLPDSASRVEGYTAALRDKYGVKIMGSIADVCAAADAVMILSFDGRPHLAQAREVIAGGKPFFLDKPVAASLKDVVEIYKAAEAAKVPMFSASAVRWYPGVVEVASAGQGPPSAALSYGPAPVLPHHPDLYFYGIHPTEALFVTMGEGCQSVTHTATPAVSVVTGTWGGDRLGTLFALHTQPMGSPHYKVVRFGTQEVVEQKSQGDYGPLLREIVKFFESRQPPVSARQTLEIYAFMTAAQKSKEQGGKRVELRQVLLEAGAPEAWLPAIPAPKPPPAAAPPPQGTPAANPQAAPAPGAVPAPAPAPPKGQ